MRRSGAPSQLQGNMTKRMRFVPPGAQRLPPGRSPTTPENSPLPLQPKPTLTNKVSTVQMPVSGRVCESRVSGALARVLSVVPVSEKTTDTSSEGEENTHTHVTDEESVENTLPPQPQARQSQPISTSPTERYFSVMWCKASNRKHKRWEGDAVLVARGRSVVLKDMEGKDISRGSGYKVLELESLAEGETLKVSGKEIEVMGVISVEDYATGRCFQEVSTVTSAVPALEATVARATAKAFSRPSLKGGVTKPREVQREIQPRHNPNAPGALVMPRPPANHQWLWNKGGLQVVDVVMDSHLTNHLRPHQREGVIFLYECIMGMRLSGRCGAILADEMGLGKTLQCVSLLWMLLRQGPYGGKPAITSALVVAPGSLVKNWGAEFNKWLGRERLRVYMVDQDHRVEDYVASPVCPVMVVSYEMVLRTASLLQKLDFGLLICDEGHRLKNTHIKTTSALHTLSCSRRIILTGTPVQNDLQEYYSIVEFVNPGVLGSAAAYRKIYEEPIIRSRQPTCTQEERSLGEERATELSRLTGVFTLRRTQEIIGQYLPGRVEWTLFCRPTPLQTSLYTHLLSTRAVRACLNASVPHLGTHSPHLACISALKKLCNHPGLLYNTMKESTEGSVCEGLSAELFPEAYSSGRFSTDESGKLLVLCDLLAAIQHFNSTDKVVLVSNYTQTLDVLQDVCAHLGYTCCRLDGSTPVAKRQSLVESFNKPSSAHFLFLLSSKAGGVGLNLVGASHLVLYDIDWNPANDIQAMARVWRDGQRKTVHIYRLLTTGTIEERIYQRQVCKQGLSGAVVDLGKGADHISFSSEELRDLFTFEPKTTCLTHHLLGCHCAGDGAIPSLPEEETTVGGRACQLGRRADSVSAPQRVSMSELMQCGHYSGDKQSYGDAYLDHAHSHITYAFQSMSINMQHST
ncbi:DNA repair and recombination protein RAD54B [Clupea harengus]|uniref:DNA repair and recombination protein RAD54B n=1 Tax=Clupea harengus TaxID=7950 RepID=A0A6P8G677_CLUHA|nr:DNA repair and recombination protein RAD54B [Clupea harengus]XP_031431561.1 DNA repair and recombination protein RAD54B [Clupea harengus]